MYKVLMRLKGKTDKSLTTARITEDSTETLGQLEQTNIHEHASQERK